MILCFPDDKNVTFLVPGPPNIFFQVFDVIHSHYEKFEKEGYKDPENIFFMKQKIGNACGTFALLHSLSNLKNKIDIGSGSFAKWLGKAEKLGVEDRSDCLLNDSEMAQAHDSCARSGETDIPGQHVEHHFISFVNVDGTLYEFDSVMYFARPVGPTSEDSFFKDVGKIVAELSSKMTNSSVSAVALVGDS